MTEGAIQAIMGREMRNIQQIIGRSASRSDVLTAVEKVLISMPTRREVDSLRIAIDEIRADMRQQRAVLQNLAATIESMRNNVQTISQKIR
jgi:methyl-accepting chemotaxis protein